MAWHGVFTCESADSESLSGQSIEHLSPAITTRTQPNNSLVYHLHSTIKHVNRVRCANRVENDGITPIVGKMHVTFASKSSALSEDVDHEQGDVISSNMLSAWTCCLCWRWMGAFKNYTNHRFTEIVDLCICIRCHAEIQLAAVNATYFETDDGE